jgi:phosphomannomutase
MLVIGYDLRGIFKKELTFELIHFATQKFFKKIDKKPFLAIDSNKNSLIIKEFLEKYFSFEFLGILPTPLLYYQVIKRKRPGIMITASHLPKKYSGLKFLLEDGSAWKPKIKSKNLNKKLKFEIQNSTSRIKEFINHKIYEDYFEKLKKIIRPKSKILVNFDKRNFFLNSSLPYFEKLNIFHSEDSSIKIKSDLDNDRIFIYYKNKKILPDLIFYYLALNKKYKNLGVPIYFSQHLQEKLLKLNKKIFIIPTGHYYFKKAFKKYNLDLAFEPSGHFYMFKDLKTESPYLALAIFLNSQENLESFLSLNEIVNRFVLKIKDNYPLEKLAYFLKKKFDLKLKRFDGYFLYRKNFYLHFRKSKTEKILKFSFEGEQKFLQEIKNATRNFN